MSESKTASARTFGGKERVALAAVGHLSSRTRGTAIRSTTFKGHTPFNFTIFARELFMHMLYPLSTPIALRTGWFNPTLLPWTPQPPIPFFFLLLGSVSTLPMALYIIFPNRFPSGQGMAGDIIQSFIVFTVHRIMVAVKYAYMDTDRYAEVRSGKASASRMSQLNVDEQLITGWLAPRRFTIQAELRHTASMLFIDLNDTFLIPAELKTGIPGETFDEEDSESTLLSLEAMCTHLVESLSELTAGFYGMKLAYPIAFVWAALSPIGRAVDGNAPFGTDALVQTALVIALLVRAFFFATLLLFCCVGVVDYMRRAYLMSALGRMTTVVMAHSGGYDTGAMAVQPIIDLAVEGNLESWLSARRLLLHMGRRFFLRCNLYLSFALLAVLALVIWLVLALLLVDSYNITLNAVWPPLVVAMLALNILLISSVKWAARANGIVGEHRDMLVQAQLGLRLHYVNTRCARKNRGKHAGSVDTSALGFTEASDCAATQDAAAFEDLDHLLRDAQVFLEVEDELRPIKLLGARASNGILQSLFGLLASGIASALNQLARQR